MVCMVYKRKQHNNPKSIFTTIFNIIKLVSDQSIDIDEG